MQSARHDRVIVPVARSVFVPEPGRPTDLDHVCAVTLTADQIIAAIRDRGSDARDLRDAAHEAHHALFANVRKRWTRDNVHAGVLRAARHRVIAGRDAALVKLELDARAVEWALCDRYGLPYELDKWADIMWWETAKSMSILLPDVDQVAQAIRLTRKRAIVETWADKIVALARK